MKKTGHKCCGQSVGLGNGGFGLVGNGAEPTWSVQYSGFNHSHNLTLFTCSSVFMNWKLHFIGRYNKNLTHTINRHFILINIIICTWQYQIFWGTYKITHCFFSKMISITYTWPLEPHFSCYLGSLLWLRRFQNIQNRFDPFQKYYDWVVFGSRKYPNLSTSLLHFNRSAKY